MDAVAAAPMEEEEEAAGDAVRHAFECDLGVCGGRHNIDHPHTPECMASTRCRDKRESGPGLSKQKEIGGEVVEVKAGRERKDGEGSSNSQVDSMHEVSLRGGGGSTGDAGPSERVWPDDDVDRDGSRGKTGGSRDKVGQKERREDEVRASRKDKAEIGRSFQLAVSTHDWPMAESFIPLADSQRLNDGLCIALDSVWFLSTKEELSAVTRLIEKLLEAGAQDFTRAALRTSFLASCVSACRSRTMSLADTVTVMAQRYDLEGEGGELAGCGGEHCKFAISWLKWFSCSTCSGNTRALSATFECSLRAAMNWSS